MKSLIPVISALTPLLLTGCTANRNMFNFVIMKQISTVFPLLPPPTLSSEPAD